MTFDTTLIISQLFNGLVWGIVLGLLAMGLAIIFGMMGVINFAHGALYLVGAYSAYTLISAGTQWMGAATGSFCVALVAAPIAVGLIGMAVEFFLLRRMYEKEIIYQFLLTFGLTLVIQELVTIIWCGMPRSF